MLAYHPNGSLRSCHTCDIRVFEPTHIWLLGKACRWWPETGWNRRRLPFQGWLVRPYLIENSNHLLQPYSKLAPLLECEWNVIRNESMNGNCQAIQLIDGCPLRLWNKLLVDVHRGARQGVAHLAWASFTSAPASLSHVACEVRKHRQFTKSRPINRPAGFINRVRMLLSRIGPPVIRL